MMSSTPARLLLADEHALFRAAMAAAFNAERDFNVVGEASTVSDVARRAGDADVVLLSTNLAGFGSARERIRAVHQSAKLVGVGDTPDRDALHVGIQAGMDGYVTKDMALSDLVAAVRQVVSGEAFVPPGMLGSLLRDLIDSSRAADDALHRFMLLTRREREVLELLVDGCDHLAVADILVISPQTARTHLQNVISKLGVHSRLEAAALAVEHRLVERMPSGKGQ